MKKITDKYGYSLHKISNEHLKCLEKILIDTVDDEPEKFKTIVVKHHLNDQGFYTYYKDSDQYEMIFIQLDTDNPLLVDTFNSFKDMINVKPL